MPGSSSRVPDSWLALPADTTAEAREVQDAALRRMGTAGRFRMTMQLCEELRELTAAGVRGRHPEYGEEQIRQAVLLLTIGEDLFRQCCPDVEIEP